MKITAARSAVTALLQNSELLLPATGARTLEDCTLLAFFRQGGRKVREGMIVQEATILVEAGS